MLIECRRRPAAAARRPAEMHRLLRHAHRAEAGMLDGVIDPFFEAMSGLTTCGATILTDIEALPRSILLWRSTIQWIGGLGVIVIFVALLPDIRRSSR